jgi:hypothetical protein
MQGDAWYFGSEASAPRFTNDKERALEFRDLTYQAVCFVPRGLFCALG